MRASGVMRAAWTMAESSPASAASWRNTELRTWRAAGVGGRGRRGGAGGGGGGEAGLGGLVEEHGVEGVAGGGVEAEGDVGQAEGGVDAGQLLLDEPDALE